LTGFATRISLKKTRSRSIDGPKQNGVPCIEVQRLTVIHSARSMIQSTSNSDHTARAGALPSQPAAPRKTPLVRDNFQSPQAEQLRETLARQPEIRPEVVARGKLLAADPSYPPPEVILKVASIILRSPDPSED
jgi:hypothetical protein